MGHGPTRQGEAGSSSVTPNHNIAIAENRVRAKQLFERAPGVLVELGPCLGWPVPEFVRQPSAKLYGRQRDGGR
jgi:hypothetical protein